MSAARSFRPMPRTSAERLDAIAGNIVLAVACAGLLGGVLYFADVVWWLALMMERAS